MRKGLFLSLGVLLLGTAAAFAEDMVLPVLAVSWPGKGGNLWSTEVFATNPGPTQVSLAIGPFLAGKANFSNRCQGPSPLRVDLPPYSTQLITSTTLSDAIGCPDFAIGGLAFSAGSEVSLVARVVNVTRAFSGISPTALLGVGQQIPVIPESQLAVAGTVYQIPGLIFDANPCAPPRFESYLYLANPGPEKVDVTLQQTQGGKTAGELVLSGAPVATPYTITLEPYGWAQYLVQPGRSGDSACTDPQVVDLFYTTNGPVAVIGTVVDRSSQEPRTVVSVPTTP